MTSRRLSVLLFWACVLAALFWQLGTRGLNEPDEGRAAGIAREMHASGDFRIPRLFDHAHLNKPPLLYWTICAAYAAGGVNEWTARLPSALAALGTLLLTASLGRRIPGSDGGTLAAAILLTSPLFFVMARLIDYNMLLTFWVTLAAWSAWSWIEGGRLHHRLIFHAALLLAFLTKGPVGPALIVAGLLIYRIRRARGWPWRSLFTPGLTAATVGLSLLWHLTLAIEHPELWRFFIGDELLGRVASDAHDRSEPLLFYVFMIPLAVLPWVIELAGSLRRMRETVRARPLLGLAWCLILFAFVLFTLSRSKLPAYILPLLPLLSLAFAAHLLERGEAARRRALWLATGIGALLPVALVAIMAHRHGWPSSSIVAPLMAGLLGAGLGGWWLARPAAPRALALLVAILPAHLVAHAAFARNEHRAGAHGTFRACAAVLGRHWQPGDRVALLTRYPRGAAFYFTHPLSVWLNRFPLQLRSDAPRVAHKDFADPAEIFRAFDSTGRVFIVGTETLLAERLRDARRPVHVLHRDDRHVLMSNEPTGQPPSG